MSLTNLFTIGGPLSWKNVNVADAPKIANANAAADKYFENNLTD